MLKKIVTWGGIAFVVFFVAFRPAAAVDIVKTLGATATDIFLGVGEALRWLVGG